MKLRTLILTGLTAFLFFLAWNAPAARLFGLLNERLPGEVHWGAMGIEGNWHHGGCRWLRVENFVCRDLRWQLHPLALCTGDLTLTAAFTTTDDGAMQGTVTANGMGLEITGLNARLPLAWLTAWQQSMGIRAQGTAEAELSRLAIRKGRLTAAQGTIRLNDLEVDQRLRLGTLAVTLTTTADGVEARIKDTGGPVQLQGLLTLTGDHGYTLRGFCAARADDPNLKDALALFGPPDEKGRIPFSQQGQIPPLRL